MANKEEPERTEQQPPQQEEPTVLIPGRNGGTLKPFVPGQSGNPKGRPKGSRSFKAIMKRLLDEQIVIPVDEAGNTMQITRWHALMLKKLQIAFDSKNPLVCLAAIKDIEDRLDGRALPQLPDVGSEGEPEYCVFYIPMSHTRKRQTED